LQKLVFPDPTAMKAPKLLGIEFIRGLSAYAVILVHSGDQSWDVPIDDSAIEFRLLFYFAVPFFLAVAFYFMTAKPAMIYSARFWRSKVERILVPYTIWTTIFFISRVIIFTLTKKPDRLQQMWQDPLSIIFFGGASVQLYFLPFLFTGFLLLLLIPLLERWQIDTLGRLGLLVVISIVLYTALESSGNGFQLSETSIAFKSLTSNLNIDLTKNPILRLILVQIAWIVRCLPYFSIALILNKLRLNEKLFDVKRIVSVGLAILFILFNTVGKMLLPVGLGEPMTAFSLLLFSISISKYFRDTSVITPIASLGFCSFGIYLIHPFIMYILKPIASKLFSDVFSHVSIVSMLILSLSSFIMSWIVVIFMAKNKSIGKYLLGM
jgi:peptidoglycan/LPS O-acetylase OafA/YrhL